MPALSVADESAPSRALEALAEAAVAVAAGGESSALLARLVGDARGLLDADRVSLLLLDPAGRLAPAVSVARHPDHLLWQKFRGLPPMPADESPAIRAVLSGAAAVVFDDADSPSLVPPRWRDAFGRSALVAAAVCADNVALGVLVVECARDGDRRLGPATTTLLTGLAALTGLALAGLRDPSRPDSPASLVAYVDASATAASEVAVAEQLLAGALATAALTRGLVVTSDGPPYRVLAGAEAWDGDDLTALDPPPADVVGACEQAWQRGRAEVVNAVVAGHRIALLPVRGRRRIRAVLALEADALPEAVTHRMAVLARISGSAFERLYALDVMKRDDEVRRLATRILDVSRSAGERGEVDALLRDVATSIGCRGAEILAAKDSVARATGWRRADGTQAAMFARWRRQHPDPAAVTRDGVVYLPVRGAEPSVIGALAVRPATGSLGGRDARCATLVAAALGQAGLVAIERRRHAEASRFVATAEARAAVAARCYAESAEVLGRLDAGLPSAAGPQGAAAAAQARALINQARRLVRDAAEASRQRRPATGLRRALTDLCAGVAARTGLAVAVRSAGRAPALDETARVALLHAVRTTLHAFDRGRAATVTVHALWSPFDVVVSVRADAVPSLAVDLDDAGLHATIRHTRAWLRPVGGRVDYAMVAGEPRFTLTVPVTGAPPRSPRSPRQLTPAHTPRTRAAASSGTDQ